ncbi:hypothetical protein RCL1_008744 [Eukaryota sp. TZLM3-RCL]
MELTGNETKYTIKQDAFSYDHTFNIQDEFGGNVFLVKGESCKWFKKLRLFDTIGNELCYIQQQPWKYDPQYNIFSGDRRIAFIKKESTLFKHKYTIDCSAAAFQVEGDFFGYDYQILKNGFPVATVSKKFAIFADSYSLIIAQGEDYLLLLSLVIVIHLCSRR